jgi:drug/metabolite transporter (DMT)-like permease
MSRAAQIEVPEPGAQDSTSVVDVAAPRVAAWLTPLELGALAAIWGASFMFQRVAAPEIGALPLGEIRLALGAAVLLPFLWRDRASFPRRLWPTLALVGAINSAIPFALFAWASQHAPAGMVAISNSLAVMFTALVAFLFYGERIGLRHMAALAAGFAGVVILASAKVAGASIGLAVLAGAAAAFLYGVGVNLVRHTLADLPPIALAAATLSLAALLLLPFAIATWPAHAVSVLSWSSAAALGVVCSGIAYALYYRLIQRIGGNRAVTVTYLVPLFAVLWAWALLGETPTWRMLFAGLLILGSVALSQRKSGAAAAAAGRARS